MPPYVPGSGRGRQTRSSEVERVEALDPAHWEACDTYRYAIDLFNHGYWWEAHEGLEELWRAAGRGTPLGTFLQGLIQISAALLKNAVGSRSAAQSLARSGRARLLRSSGPLLGIDPTALTASVDEYLSGRSEIPPQISLRVP
jgi:hypothetical protein